MKRFKPHSALVIEKLDKVHFSGVVCETVESLLVGVSPLLAERGMGC
jgi:hypothetical protein